MPSSGKQPYSTGTHAYIFLVAGCGALVVGLSIRHLLTQAYQVPDFFNQWLILVGLTIVSGLLPVTIRSLHVTVSISETFVIAGTLLFGTAAGTVLVLLDALFISMFLYWFRGIRWQQVVFNLGVTPLSIWAAAVIAQIEPQFSRPGVDASLVVRLTVFTTLDYLFNTWLLTFVLALQQRARPIDIRWRHFRELLVNYAAGGSIAALLVYNSREVKPEFILAILPLLIVLFLTYS